VICLEEGVEVRNRSSILYNDIKDYFKPIMTYEEGTRKR